MRFIKQFLADRNGNVLGGVEQNGNGRPKPLFEANPYLNARREWNSQIDRAFSSLAVWRLIAVAALLIAFASVAGIVYIGAQSKYVPYVVEVDRLGETVAVGPAQVAAPADSRVIRASLAAFIVAVRTVTPDQDLQRRFIFAAYGMLRQKDPAAVKLNELLGDGSQMSPFKRASTVTVNAEISSVLALTERSWSVNWTETTRDRDGALVGNVVNMRATLDIYIDPPAAQAKQADIQRNPIGIWIRDYNWQSL